MLALALAAALAVTPSCHLKGARVAQANAQAVLLQSGWFFVGCYRRAPKLQFIAEFEGGKAPRIGVLRGHFAASDGQECDRYYDTCDALVEVVDLKRHKSVSLFDAATEIHDIALKANGSVVVMATMPRSGVPEVWTLDKHGTRALDQAPGIDPGSLALAGGTARWTRDGHEVTAAVR
jgi:hypothetical protein